MSDKKDKEKVNARVIHDTSEKKVVKSRVKGSDRNVILRKPTSKPPLRREKKKKW